MSEQSNNNSGGNQQRPQSNQGGQSGQGQNNRRHNNRRRHRPGGGQGNNAEPRQAGQGQGQQGQQARPQGQHPNRPNQPQGQQGQGQGQKKKPRPHHNRPRPQGQGQPQGPVSPLERIYEKYLNLLDQHIIARRKYHDLFYRADPAQKAKLERNFYNTLNDIREFENKLAPDVKVLFEKRNNGYQNDRIYTTNHALPIEGDVVPEDLPPAEPHLLQSQINCDYSEDTEESVGTAEDYLRYKNL
ncbi:hypothetical protein C0V70_08475 [Bacteriovorax stolpii]|uniref:Uncharacterized protein n=1 Tax=Bacteriovorax stolpii TaxID=960 RepID=A0A2K9NRM7_BACTC|nr:hypothetical protein [Bacteriovorax stolpii]AUN98142.1 hypothetical protein C0V70_08475 [Bacteriovorax stolpii]TDP52056.1 hypothetical protein C8D79_2704 [Bacteriovorax stolpii]